MNIRALQRLYALLEERKQDFRYRIVVSVLEIYNENIHDLLADAKSDKDRKCVRFALRTYFAHVFWGQT